MNYFELLSKKILESSPEEIFALDEKPAWIWVNKYLLIDNKYRLKFNKYFLYAPIQSTNSLRNIVLSVINIAGYCCLIKQFKNLHINV